jgi:hypothetical protein
VIILIISNTISGYYCAHLINDNKILQEQVINSEKEKIKIVNDLKNDFLIYLQNMIIVQKDKNTQIDSLIKK